ncbi:uncharacterized protein LOC130892774 isoform X2 [Diorhabda carinulata]|uniref:uncharacterized protein LOC130892774 isoform X2 n=1 Tax=Diorhabda carinulata TaxID=1163345 RepID=UPI0025A1FEF1|nr:uncharacterized protein LOC130892774 isoform X2 [Diorhabda carinulata]XP_057654393.1 uncharacterized protein LOC130892774 isoform X2 [Diorhabda carinulata]
MEEMTEFLTREILLHTHNSSIPRIREKTSRNRHALMLLQRLVEYYQKKKLPILLECDANAQNKHYLGKQSHQQQRTNKYLQKSSISRVCAVGGFFVSIPVFLTGIILYTFIQFHSTPAIVTSVFIGLGIIFCGCAMVHNVFIWQKEKTDAVRELALQHQETTSQHNNSLHSITSVPATHLNHSYVSSFGHPIASVHNGPYILRPSTTTPPSGENLNLTKMSHPREASGSVSPGMPNVTMELSSVCTTNSPHELSTLV